ncbi:hypothetical protein LEAN103870_15035 [Legionella anisa]|uniref:Uncharacterized protein n=1 Tax=Legionella anisa TaxID=28082 RepID=A0AAX0X067_9GAMM|nr:MULTISPECIES: hypothetical protein [Legionella]HAT9164568.1 hypothetical protein [Legionella pneumophila subsp. pneumophila]AOU90865.1 hypothetical protein A9E96_15055 [Legionella pneumophila]AWN76046.1 hypothetical protein DLD14_19400 [Legionella anisa]MCW8426865.1 hypothetical protein [Legionella anisa]MCW8449594.1 hypothetical protein [Legionella anisa]
MSHQYAAKIYVDDTIIANSSGDNVEQLYVWMLAKVNGSRGNIRGEIIENATQKIVRHFKKAAIE